MQGRLRRRSGGGAESFNRANGPLEEREWRSYREEGLYAVSHTKEKRRLWGGRLLAAAFLVAGVLTVLFGE